MRPHWMDIRSSSKACASKLRSRIARDFSALVHNYWSFLSPPSWLSRRTFPSANIILLSRPKHEIARFCRIDVNRNDVAGLQRIPVPAEKSGRRGAAHFTGPVRDASAAIVFFTSNSTILCGLAQTNFVTVAFFKTTILSAVQLRGPVIRRGSGPQKSDNCAKQQGKGHQSGATLQRAPRRGFHLQFGDVDGENPDG